MAHLSFYRKEKNEWFEEAYSKNFKSLAETKIVFNKLIKHFKLRGTSIRWTSGNRHPKAIGNGLILLNWDYNSFGILCHEISHIIQHRKFSKTGHNKQLRKIIKKVVNYCKRKNWFEEELARRTAPKPIKPEPTEQELLQQKIIHLKENCKRYQVKVKMYSNKLKKTCNTITKLEKRGGASSILNH